MRFDWNNKAVQWAVLLLLGIIWGASYILMKRGLEAFSSTQVAALRLSIAFLILLPLILKSLRKLNRRNILSLAIAAVTGIALPAFLFTLAETRVSSWIAGVLNSLSPLFTLVIGVVLYRNYARFTSIVGVLLGLLGASVLIVSHEGLSIHEVNGYAMLVVLATLCYGINSNEIKHRLADLSGLEVTALVFLLVGPPSMAWLAHTGFNPVHFSHAQLTAFFYVFILALFGSVFAVILYNQLLLYVSAVSASSVTYISPVFAIMWGRSDGEYFGSRGILSLIVILAGVYLVNKTKFNEQKT